MGKSAAPFSQPHASTDRQKYLDDLRVKVRACQRADVLQDLVTRPRLTIGTVRAQRVPDIDHGKDARRPRNVFACELPGVSGPVPLFVVAIRNVERRAKK